MKAIRVFTFLSFSIAAVGDIPGAGAHAKKAAEASLTLQVSNETAPPGGWVQFKISVSAPALIASGDLSMDFDPSIFGPVAQLAVFSATGDQIGYANVIGEHLDVHFSSASAGVGQLPELPVFTVTLPVLRSAIPGSTASITATTTTTTGNNWIDPAEMQYAVTLTPGKFTVGGSLSVEALLPGAGLLPAGTVLQLSGTGFDSGTRVAIDGVSIAGVHVIDTGRINLILGGAIEMTGKHVHVTNSAGAQADYYTAAPSAPLESDPQDSLLAGVHAILPLVTYTGAEMNNPFVESTGSLGLAMFNPSRDPVTITLAGFGGIDPSSQLLYLDTLSIPASGLSMIDALQLLGTLDLFGELWISSSAPVRFVTVLRTIEVSLPSVLTTVSLPPQVTNPEPPIQVKLVPSPNSVTWSWQTGTPAPAPATVTLLGNFAFNTAVSAGAAPWLSVSSARNGFSSTLTFTPTPSGLSAGVHSGTVVVTPIAPASLSGVPVVPVSINVTLTATNSPMISYSPVECCGFFEAAPNQGAGPPETLTVVTNGNPAHVTLSASTSSGGNWLTVSPLSGTTPLTVTVMANTVGLNLAPGNYTGQITIQGPANTVTATVGLNVFAPPMHGTTLMINGPAPNFTLAAGTPQSMSAADFLSFQEFDVALTSVKTDVPWLNAGILSAGPAPPAGIALYPNSVGLSPGVYSGTITINSSNYPVLAVPATLTVLAAPTAETMLTATPASLSFTSSPNGVATSQNVAISFNGSPVEFNLLWDAQWLRGGPATTSTSAAPVLTVGAVPNGLAPGTYYAGLVIDWTTGSITIPVTFSITSTSAFPPIIAAIVNSASATRAAIAPGEIVTLFGSGIGAAPEGAQSGSGGIATSIGDTRVLINGIAAPLLYASASQVNAVVPYEVGSTGLATVEVVSNGVASAAWDVPLTPAAPAIFTANSSGAGQAAVLNQDNSRNSPSNPAARGTIVQIFATGGGETQPAAVTGALAPSGELLKQTVQVTIGGVQAAVSYAGAAPGEVNGLVQINAKIPQNVAPGARVPVAVTIGNARSPSAATIAVR